ncbi:MAG TPA: hypothetical protein PLH72_16255 [Vicinamibacterales bacterium]|nr:hypothetical protein [Vicinamibacterales bacterium]
MMNEMPGDEAVEKWLSSALAAEPLGDDEPFTAAVLRRIDRHAGRRRLLLTIGYAAAIIVGLASIPDASVSWAAITPMTFAGMMTLSALCGLVWIATD